MLHADCEMRPARQRHLSCSMRREGYTNLCFHAGFLCLVSKCAMERTMLDVTIVKAHRLGQGAKGGLKARPYAAYPLSLPKKLRSRCNSPALAFSTMPRR